MGPDGPKWGQEDFFPTNPDLADILGRIDLDFWNFYFLDFVGSQISRFPGPIFPNFQKSGLAPVGTQLGPSLGPAWAQLGPGLGPAWARAWARLGPGLGPARVGRGPSGGPGAPRVGPRVGSFGKLQLTHAPRRSSC